MINAAFREAEHRMDRDLQARQTRAKKERDHTLLTQAHQKAVEALEETGRIDPQSFMDNDPTTLAADLAYIGELEKKFKASETAAEKMLSRDAVILEGIIQDCAELDEWLGPEATTRPASRFDDVVNGVDSIAEFTQEHGTVHLALAIDVSYGHPTTKLERIKKEIHSGKLTTVKYFESADGAFRGSLSRIPRVIVGVDHASILELTDLWMHGKHKQLAEHPAQLLLLEQISLQLRTFAEYADRIHQSEIAAIYRRQLALIESVKNTPEKQALYKRKNCRNYLAQSRFSEELRTGLEHFASYKLPY